MTAWVTRPERPKGAKDEAISPQGLQLEVGARRAPRLLVYNIFCDQLVDCFGYSKYTKHPRVQICWRAHIKLHGLGQCNNVPRYLAVFFLSDEVLPSIKLYCITSQGSLRLHATVDLKVPTAECTRTGKPCTLHPHLAPPKEKVVRASALGMPAATKMDEFF